MALPLRIDPDKPLPDEIKLYIGEHGPRMLRALVNELAAKNEKLRVVTLERDELRQRLRDNRGMSDA